MSATPQKPSDVFADSLRCRDERRKRKVKQKYANFAEEVTKFTAGIANLPVADGVTGAKFPNFFRCVVIFTCEFLSRSLGRGSAHVFFAQMK